MKNKLNQRGFGVIELLIILVIVIGVGVAGYLVYKNHHKTTPATPITSSSNNSSTTNASYLKINGWGVQMPTVTSGPYTVEFPANAYGQQNPEPAADIVGTNNVTSDALKVMVSGMTASENICLQDKGLQTLADIYRDTSATPQDLSGFTTLTSKHVGGYYYFLSVGIPSKTCGITSLNSQQQALVDALNRSFSQLAAY